MKVPLTLAFSRSAMTAPLLDGEVEITGVDLNPQVINPADLFWRQLHHAEFDLSELSLGGLIMQKARDTAEYSLLPAFPSRAFFHTAIRVHRDAGISSPADLRGKRVGIKEYQQTAAIWMRGALQHEWGISPSELQWWMGRRPDRSHGTATGFTPPVGVEFNYIEPGDSLGRMLVEHRIDAWLCFSQHSGGFGLGQESELHSSALAEGFVDSAEPDITGSDQTHMLFPDPHAEWQRYNRKTGVLPMNHGIALRTSLAERHPWLARNCYDAFQRARALAKTRFGHQLEQFRALGAVDDVEIGRVQRLFDYGRVGFRPSLDALLGYAFEQGILPRPVTNDELFFPSVTEL